MHDVPAGRRRGGAHARRLLRRHARRAPARSRTDDLTSALLDAEIDGDRLTDDEIIGFLFLMVVAGNETTTKLLGNAWYWALAQPRRSGPSRSPTRRCVADWVEETLRYDTSSQMLARVTTDGRRAARRDDRRRASGCCCWSARPTATTRVFRDPDRYDLDRDTSAQLVSFGVGRHFCLGASLARLEAPRRARASSWRRIGRLRDRRRPGARACTR